MLPSDTGGRTTRQVGFFAAPAEVVAPWLATALGPEWSLRHPRWASLEAALVDLVPKPVLSRFALVPLDGSWTVLLNDTPLGTDVGVLPSRAAEQLGCRAIRATCVDDGEVFPARILEVYGPAGALPLFLERSVAAANDGGRWVFETYGPPFEFEDRSETRGTSRRSTVTRSSSVRRPSR